MHTARVVLFSFLGFLFGLRSASGKPRTAKGIGIGYWLLPIVCCLLAIGYWLLPIGYWLCA
jgi:hypothetical protein